MALECVECPKCRSDEKVVTLDISYPKSYECKNCGCIFIKSPKSLIDE